MTEYFGKEDWYNGGDEKSVRQLMEILRKKGLRGLKPIRITQSLDDFPLSAKGVQEFKAGKWMVWDGFHRIYAARRMGYKTIRAEVY